MLNVKGRFFLAFILIGTLGFYSSLARAQRAIDKHCYSYSFTTIYSFTKSRTYWNRLKEFIKREKGSNCSINDIRVSIPSQDWSILHYISSRENSSKRLDNLLDEYGDELDINIQTSENSEVSGYTPLHLLVKHSRLKNLKTLVNKRPDLKMNVQDVNGDTPLMYALYFSSRKTLKIVNFLIQNGADINIKNNQGKTVLDLAREEEAYFGKKKYSKIVEFLERHSR